MLSVTILTKNCADTLGKTLAALTSFDDVVVLDNGSCDETLAIAESYPNVRLFKAAFIGFGPLHQLATAHALHDWILSIDSDEVPSPALLEELAALQLDETKVYELPRLNFYRGHPVRHGTWNPDRVVRLFNRHRFQFSSDQVHEKVLCEKADVITLKAPLWHTPYRGISDFLRKMQLYSDLFAAQSTKKSSPLIALRHGLGAFIKSYLLKCGVLDGYAGFLIAAYNGHTAFYKYLKLYEKN